MRKHIDEVSRDTLILARYLMRSRKVSAPIVQGLDLDLSRFESAPQSFVKPPICTNTRGELSIEKAPKYKLEV